MSFTPDQKLKEILSDNKSGSTELLIELSSYILNNFSDLDLNDLIPFLKSNFKEFSAVQNFLFKLESFSTDDYSGIENFILGLKTKQTAVIRKIFETGYNEFKNYKNLITISNSTTVCGFLKLFSELKKDLNVIVCESRPVFEGRLLAEYLNSYSINTELITEAMIAQGVMNADAAVIGADTILKNGDAVNKVGSKLLAISCRYYNKPFYVLADKSKYSDNNKFSELNKPASEIWDCQFDNISINNKYFETVEKDLITRLITD